LRAAAMRVAGTHWVPLRGTHPVDAHEVVLAEDVLVPNHGPSDPSDRIKELVSGLFSADRTVSTDDLVRPLQSGCRHASPFG